MKYLKNRLDKPARSKFFIKFLPDQGRMCLDVGGTLPGSLWEEEKKIKK